MNPASHDTSAPPTGKVLAAFLAIYFVWGSTYVAISYANESLPPFLMASVRFLIAGTILLLWSICREGAAFVAPTRAHWRSALIVGGLLLLGGNGGVVWAESGDRVPSGLAAVMVATVPMWVVLLEWLRRGGVRPTMGVVIGLLLGFVGIVLLMDPGKALHERNVDTLGAIVLACGSLSWATGSVYSRHTPMPRSPILSTAMQMLCGGLCLGVFGTLAGDWAKLDLAKVTKESWLAWGYLIVMGSLVGFTAYIWLLRVTTPARVATYAYVNPVVAIALGWASRGEKLTGRTLLAAGIIIVGVVFITATKAAGGARVSPPGRDRPLSEPRP